MPQAVIGSLGLVPKAVGNNPRAFLRWLVCAECIGRGLRLEAGRPCGRCIKGPGERFCDLVLHRRG